MTKLLSFPPPLILVLMFQEVWGRSFCRTIEKLVEVVQEYPSEVEHIYSPACVPLVRCAGCCGDENLECHPTHTSNVTMQVRQGICMTFVEHQTCECRCIGNVVPLVGKGKEEEEGRERRDRKRKNVTGDGAISSVIYSRTLKLAVNSIKNPLFFIVFFSCQIPRR
uniref:Placental growth factor b n=1 Tax=Cyclopterus lumpus TaxID=8103 RepID=A0A8C2ZUY8_CYCLU